MSPLEQKILLDIENQRQGIAAREAQMADLSAQPKQPDISPLLQIADVIGGTNYASQFKPQDNQMQLQRMAQGIQGQKERLTRDEINLLRMQQQSQFQQDQLSARKEMQGMKAAEKKEKESKLSQSMIKKINEGNAIPDMLNTLNTTILNNEDMFGPFVGRMASANPYNTQAQKIDAEMRAKSQAFGRFMEGGVLRKEDEDKYRKMFPQLSDTPEVAQEKLRIVMDLLAEKQGSDIAAFEAQGFDMTGLKRVSKEQTKKAEKKAETKSTDFDSMSDEELLKRYNNL